MNSGSRELSTGPFCVIFHADSESGREIWLRAPRSPENHELLAVLGGRGAGGISRGPSREGRETSSKNS
eukprot:15436139-Alexandrium_andersonii.AAC.1